ncbi:MAG: glycosyltransferase [Methylococcaceae bacterium]
MRIVIDMQGAQTSGSRFRGIGRYTLSLAQAIVRNRGYHEVFLALNGLFPDTIEPIRAAFDELMLQENIRVWQAPGPVCSLINENNWRRHTAELVREAFLASLKPDIVVVSSLFEGMGDDAVTSVGTLSKTIPTAVLLYDLIPLIQRSPYLENPVVESWYENKLDHLHRADLLLAISESSRQEGIRYLGFSAETCINISTAADPQFQPAHIDLERETAVRNRYGLLKPFVMYTGGIDQRKNIEGLIRAYSMLPRPLRANHQLAIVCSIQPHSRTELETLAKETGLKAGELVLTGFVTEEDLLALYNLCKTFVFPSWHEGFGLPALEAMSCGRAVIGANTSSLPEVIGRDDAQFDPMNDTAIAEKLAQVLTDDNFRSELEQYGLKRAKLFTWDTSAKRAITALEALHIKFSHPFKEVMSARRPKLAYVSPLPPERSGISDYSVELLPALSRHYDIDVIVAQDSVSNQWINANCTLRSVAWLKDHADLYDRVLYHFGNSHFHQHMFSLLEEVPGVVVLHDFFLSHVLSHMDFTGYQPKYWEQILYQSHGYAAAQQWFNASDTAEVVWRYPCNLGVLQSALGVVVHSEHSRRLARRWYGDSDANEWMVVPHLRDPVMAIDRAEARRLLKFNHDDFVVCSFGVLGPIKLNHRLLNAWLASTLAKNANCVLVFVGENQGGDYGMEITTTINKSGVSERIRITGWADTDTFRHYLAAADVGVQLRTLSRGETSGTVLDCMNYGLPTIVNANGSMADLPNDGVLKLPDEFDDNELVYALETLMQNSDWRQQLGTRAREIILSEHNPQSCAGQYAQAIETVYHAEQTSVSTLILALSRLDFQLPEAQSLMPLAESIALSIPPRLAPRQLLVDISELVQRDSKSGIQRVVRSILNELLKHPPEGYRIEPVYATTDQGYRYARRFTLLYLGCQDSILTDNPIEFRAGDLFFGLDLQPEIVLAQQTFYQQLRNYGVQIQFVVYDLLPITLPMAFSEEWEKSHNSWLKVVAENDGAMCISKSVADELSAWIKTNGPTRQRPFKIGWFHLGADIDASVPSKGMPDASEIVLNQIVGCPSFLMVGTLEPRKGHTQALEALEKLWEQGLQVNLVIVGQQGWIMKSLVNRLRHHPELGKRLFWLEGISDEFLEKLYAASACLIAASEGEGFGLPLIEAAQHKLPIIARDIPVFREVAGKYAYYFSGLDSKSLAETVTNWLALYVEGKAPRSDDMPWLTWSQSAQQLLKAILSKAVTTNTGKRQLLIDASNIIRYDLKSGIERVVRAQLMELIKDPPKGFSVEPVYLTDQGGQWHYRYARSYTSEILDIEQVPIGDAPIDVGPGDLFYGLDFCPGGVIEAAKSGIYSKWKATGLSINFLVYDLLPVLKPEFFPDGASTIHAIWLKTIAEISSRLICISNAVADELRLWLKNNIQTGNEQLMIDAVHLGADIIASAPSRGLPDNSEKVLKKLSTTPTFVLVGTIEPRKGHLQTLAAFDQLWEQGHQLNLVIVGKEGWKALPYNQRRTIRQIVRKLRKHNELGSRLFWLEGISDEYLEKVYASSTCLITASEGEGFGLPLIEAAQHRLPIIARDIPVFREVAGEHAYYFSGLDPQALAESVKNWLALNTGGNAPQSAGMSWLTWSQSTQQLLAAIIPNTDVLKNKELLN